MYTFRYSSLVSAGLKAHLLVSMRQICVTFVTAAFARALTIRYHYTYAAPLRNVWVRTAMLIGYAPPSTHVRAPRAGRETRRGGVADGPRARQRRAAARRGPRTAGGTGRWPLDRSARVARVGRGVWGLGRTPDWRSGARLAPYFVDPYFLTRPDSSF